jgi:anti-sigma B factor antagonist
MIATLNVREASFIPVSVDWEAPRKPIPVLSVTGRLDASTVNILERALMRALMQGTKAIVIDASGITYISSSGLRVLLTARRQVRERDGDILLCALSPNVRDVMNMVGFTALFSVYESLDEARNEAARFK